MRRIYMPPARIRIFARADIWASYFALLSRCVAILGLIIFVSFRRRTACLITISASATARLLKKNF